MQRRKTMLERWDEDDRIFLGLRIKERLYPAIIGGVVGDALGVPVEFKERNIGIKGMIGYGTYNQPEGTWSDDTSLTLCLIENMIEKNDLSGLMEKFVDYRENGYWTPYGEMFDIGRTTVEAIMNFKNGAPIEKCGGVLEFDNGNGALMRISPLVFTIWDEKGFGQRRKEIESVAEITHRHPRSTLGCIIYLELLINLFHNNNISDSIDMTIDTCIKELSIDDKYKNELKYYNRILDKSILDVSRDDIISDGYVVHSLEAAIWCFLKTNSYRDAVLEAVNLGGDTDTIAQITGTMAGMYYRMDGIPEEWVNKLARKEEIFDLCERFFQYCFKKADESGN